MKVSLAIFSILMGILFAQPCAAQSSRDRRNFSLLATSSNNSDLKTTRRATTTSETMLANTLDLELGIRLHTIFQFIAVGYRSRNGVTSGYGGGFRIDIPGFFWLGGPERIRNVRRFHPINSSLYGLLVQTSIKNESGTVDRAVGSEMGFSLDIFLFNPRAFLTGKAGIINVMGNSYMTTGAGLGIEF